MLARMKAITNKFKIWWDKLMSDRASRLLFNTILLAALGTAVCFTFYSQTHAFDDFSISETVQEDDIDGTRYEMLGDYVIKYSPDGVFCVDTMNNTIWSSAYSMQTPICDVCGDNMVIAEEHGMQVYVLNSKGVVGNFATTLPIEDARISENHVVLLKLQDSEATWLNMYDTSGTELASIKTTVPNSGYPISEALSSDARKVLVAYSGEKDGQLRGQLILYDFSSVSASEEEHIAGSREYPHEVFPYVYFGANDTPIAVGSSEMIVFKRGSALEEKTSVGFDREIVSVFNDDKNCGFIFRSDLENEKYHMEVYNNSGSRVMDTDFNFNYTGTRMDNGEILVYDEKNLYSYRTSGRQKLNTAYNKEVVYFAKMSGFHKYLVITADSMDQIKVK